MIDPLFFTNGVKGVSLRNVTTTAATPITHEVMIRQAFHCLVFSTVLLAYVDKKREKTTQR